MASLGGRAKLAEQAQALLVKLPNGVFRQMMQKRLADLIGLQPGQLGSQPAPEMTQRRRPLEKRGAQQTISPVRRAITLLLLKPELGLLPGLPQEWRSFRAPGISLLGQLLEIVRLHPHLKAAQIIERWRGESSFQHLERIWSEATELATPEPGMEDEFRGALQRLVEQHHEQETTQLLERVSAGGASEQEKQRLGQLLSEKQKRADSNRPPD